MSGRVNPIVLIQMLMQYHNYRQEGGRTFKFTKNNRMRVHTETESEMLRRKSVLQPDIRSAAERAILSQLKDTLRGRLGKIWIDDISTTKRLAVPLQMSTGQSGYGIMPTGSRLKIPDGKKMRIFTYWEKVNDIDLSCFGMDENGECVDEYSWRSAYDLEGDSIVFSGDETSGYKGGSEYFDIDIDAYRTVHPEYRYIIVCDNIFSGSGSIHFKDVVCTAGYMERDILDSGEVFEPKTVKSSYRITTDSSYGYLLALDLKEREVIWLNVCREGNHAIAGNTSMKFLIDYMTVTDVVNFYDILNWSGEITEDLNLADVLVTDDLSIPEDDEKHLVIRSWDLEKMLALIQAK